MSKLCTVPNGETIVRGDAVCVTGFDTAKKRPIVKRATRANLTTSQTVFGVAEDNAVFENGAAGGSARVLVAGEVAENAITKLGNVGSSRIVATNSTEALDQGQCRLIRIDRPDGSEYVVGTCDENGNLVVQPRASRATSNLHVFNVRSFGAVPDWTPTNPSPTDNLPFFQAALTAMAASGNRGAKLVADGHFFLSDTLVLTQTIVLEGTGQNEPPPFFESSRSTPGTMLVFPKFPKNVTGIRIRGGSGLDNPTKTYDNPFPPSAEKTILRNLTIYSKDDIPDDAPKCRDEEDACIVEEGCIHGIYASTIVRLENVTVENFTHDGIHMVGGDCCKSLFNKNGKIVSDCDPVLDIDCQPLLDNVGNPVRACDGNVAGSYVENCIVGGCGRDGFHIRGGDAATCVINCCSAVVNRRYGFFDKTRVNTYIGCHAEGNSVEYHTEGSLPAPASGYNSSTFVGCYAEGNGDRCEFYGDVTVIGGAIGDTNVKKDSTVFILEHGVASHSPYKYNNDRNGAGNRIVACLGSENGDAPDALSFGTPDAPNTDYNVLRYDSTKHWWELQNSSQHRRPIAFPTMQCGSRQAAPQFRHGIFLGGDAGALADVSFIAAPTLPATQYSSDNAPLTYEMGDVVWQSAPVLGGPLGWVCVQAGMQDQLRFATTGDLLAFDTALTLANPTSFAVNQFITIAGVTGIRQIVALAGSVATLNTAGDNAANIVDGAVAVKMIGTIPNGSPALVVDDTSRLLIGQYIAIAGVTGRQKIVSLGTPAALECATAETYDFDDGFTLVVQIDNGPVQTVTFHTADFADIHAALASEVAMLLDAALTYSSTTATSGGTKVTITSEAKGLSSHVQVTGGTANAALGFSPSVVDGTANLVTIETPNADATATDAIIEFWPATFSTFGVVESPSKSYAVDTPLTLADRYITVIETGMTMTLPASPVDGQTHSIKSRTNVTTKVDSAGGVLIDGTLTTTVEPLENRTFRYSAAMNEWEIR
jgi:hypothetical protein